MEDEQHKGGGGTSPIPKLPTSILFTLDENPYSIEMSNLDVNGDQKELKEQIKKIYSSVARQNKAGMSDDEILASLSLFWQVTMQCRQPDAKKWRRIRWSDFGSSVSSKLISEPSSLHIKASTEQFISRKLEIKNHVRNLEKQTTQYRNMIKEAEKNYNDEALDIAFLYGSPLYKGRPRNDTNEFNSNNLLRHLIQYLGPFNSMIKVLEASKKEIRLEFEEFNETNFKKGMKGNIIFCVVHGEVVQEESDHPTKGRTPKLFGEDKYGALELITPKNYVLRPNLNLGSEQYELICPLPTKQINKISLLVVQTSLPIEDLAPLLESAEEYIVIRSNVAKEDRVADSFISSFFQALIVDGKELNDAVEQAKRDAVKENNNEVSLCICLQKENTDFKGAPKPFPKYELLAECDLAHQATGSFHMNMLEGVANPIDRKILARNAKINLPLKEGKLKFPEYLTAALREAQEKHYDFALSHHLESIALIFSQWKKLELKNISRMVVNLVGEYGRGKNYLKRILKNYMVIKKIIDGARRRGHYEIISSISYADADHLSGHNISLIIMDLVHYTFGENVSFEKLKELLLAGKSHLLVLSKEAKDSDIANAEKSILVECKGLTSEEDIARMLLRELKNNKVHPSPDLMRQLKEEVRQLAKKGKFFSERQMKRIIELLDLQAHRDKGHHLTTQKVRLALQPRGSIQPAVEDEALKLLTISMVSGLTAKEYISLFRTLELSSEEDTFNRLENFIREEEMGFRVKDESRLNPTKLYSALKPEIFSDYYTRILKGLNLLVLQLTRTYQRNHANNQTFFDATAINPCSMLSIWISRQEQVEQAVPEWAKELLDQEDRLISLLNDFLIKTFFSVDPNEIQEKVVTIEFTKLVCLTTSLMFIKGKKARMEELLRGLSSKIRKNEQKPKNSELDRRIHPDELEQIMLESAFTELQFQILLEKYLITYHTTSNDLIKREIDTEEDDKRLEELVERLLQLKIKLQKAIQEECGSTSNQYLYLASSALKFNLYLAQLVRFTCLIPMTPTKNIQVEESKVGCVECEEDEEKIRKLAAMQKVNEEEEHFLKQLNIDWNENYIRNKFTLKFLAGLLVQNSPRLRTHIEIPGRSSERERLEEAPTNLLHRLKNIIEILSKLEELRIQKLQTDDLKQVNQMFRYYKKLGLATSDNLPKPIREMLVSKLVEYDGFINDMLRERPIFTLVVNDELGNCRECFLGIQVQLNFSKIFPKLLGVGKLIVETIAQRNMEGIKQAIARGSQYLCIWCDHYTNDKASMETVDKAFEQLKNLEESRLRSRAQKLKTIVLVCNNPQLSDRLAKSKSKYTPAIISLCSQAIANDSEEFSSRQTIFIEFIRNMVVSLHQQTGVTLLKGVHSLITQLDKEQSAFIKLLHNAYALNSGVPDSQPKLLVNDKPQSSKSLDQKSNFFHPTIFQLTPKAVEGNHIEILRGESKNIELKRILYVLYKTPEGQSKLLLYLQTICQKRQLYSDGVYIINCSTYKPDRMRSRIMEHDLSEPVYFVENQLKLRLPELEGKNCLLMFVDADKLFTRLKPAPPKGQPKPKEVAKTSEQAAKIKQKPTYLILKKCLEQFKSVRVLFFSKLEAEQKTMEEYYLEGVDKPPKLILELREQMLGDKTSLNWQELITTTFWEST